MIGRRAFLAMTAAAAIPLRSRADQYDPAVTAASPELRVLLGRGTAAPLPGGGFTFAGRTYRGSYEALPDGGIVNTLLLEEYLYSVVPREMTPSWPAAALQAQAICARTYVLQRSNPLRGYDVVPSEIDQVYGGIASESPAGRSAVDATAGSVLRYNGRFAQAMYSSCCGGHTEAASDAWGGAPIPYLAGVTCTTCTGSPYYRWTRSLALERIAGAFAPELAPYGALRGVAITGTDPSGRVRSFTLQAQTGSVQSRGSTFRLRVGARTLPSLLVTRIDAAGTVPGSLAFQGGGLGHGVGLCQWGARGLALQGATFRDILQSYFPGTDIDHE